MGQRVASLEIELAMATGGAIDNAVKFGGVVDKVTQQAIRDLDKIDAAIAGVGDMSGATASMVRFADETAKSAVAAAREFARIEKAGESMAAQLDRQISVFGKTTAEIRSMKAESAALAAEQAGQIELAGRIRAAEQTLYDMEFAAMRKVRAEAEALAEDRAAAAAVVEREAAAAKIAATAADNLAAAHQRLASMVQASHAADEENAASLGRLRQSTDPLAVAIERLNAEIAESTRLYHAGTTAPDEYARQQQVLTGRLAEAQQQHEALATSAGKSGFAMKQFAIQLPDIAQGLLTGQPPMQVFIQQGGQVAQIAMMAEGGVKGFAAELGALALTAAPLLTAFGTVAAVAFGAFKQFQSQVKDDGDLTHYRDSLGLTHKEMLQLSDGTDKAGGKIKELTGVTVTAGDVMAGLWKTIQDGAQIDGPWDKIKSGAATAFGYVLEAWNIATAGITAGIYGTFNAVEVVWKSFPAVFGDIFVQGVNAAIDALNKLVKAGTDGLNSLIAGVDNIPGVKISQISAPQISEIDNANAGAAAKAAQAIGDGYKKAYADARASDAAFWKQVGDNAKQHAKDRMSEEAKAIIANRTPTKPKVDHNALDAAAEEAQIANLYKLADAYKVSDAAALIAEATTKATTKAIKDQGDVAAEVSRQVRLAIAQRVNDAENSAASANFEADAQEAVNKQVEAGLIPAAAAAGALRDMIDLRQAQAGADAAAILVSKSASAANVDAYKRATQAVEDLAASQKKQRAAAADAQFIQDTVAGDKQLAQLRLEGQLIGANDAVRVHALATLKATQDVQDKIALGLDPAKAKAWGDQQVAIADATEANRQAQDDYSESLSFAADMFDAIDQNAQRAGQGIADAFGSAGRSIADALTSVTGYYSQQARLQEQHDAAMKRAAGNQQQMDRENALYAERSGAAQIGMYGDIAEAAKGLFKEHSTGYKAMEAAEQTFRAVQLALSVASIVQNALETTTTVANAAVKAAAEGTVGIAKQSQEPFPANLAAMAATAAALVAIGVAVAGSIGGGKNTLPAANEGKGTVLGDSDAQSKSIENAIAMLTDVDRVTMTTSSDMLKSLRSIESHIGNLASLLVRTGNIDASAGVDTGFKTDAIGSILKATVPLFGSFLSSLFGSKTTVVGAGLYGGAQSIGSVLDGGYDAGTYSDIQKKKKFLGITTGTKYSTQYGDASDEVDQQFGAILKGFYSTISAAAGPLGLATGSVEDKLKGFVVDIGKIDLQGLTGDQISDKLTAVFGAAADNMAKAVMPGLEKFQAVGEGYFETLVRVSNTVETVGVVLGELGGKTQKLGVDASMGLAGMFDSLDDFSSSASEYFQDYYTEAEQTAAKTAQMTKAFGSLGLSMPDSIAGFRKLVEAQNLTTTSGQETYAALLKIAPAFADLKGAATDATSAAEIIRQQQDLQQQLLEAEGDTAAIRKNELDALDPSNRALQQRIWDLQDEKAATDAASQAAQAKAQADAAIANERAGLEQQLLQAEGKTDAIRKLQLAALDPSNRALQQQVWALTDQAAATQAAAQAAEAAAQKEAAAAEELAQKQSAIAQQRSGLEQQLWEQQGKTATIRKYELAQLDPTNRAIQEHIWRLQDEAAASDAAAQAAQAKADKDKAIADEAAGIQQQIWEAQGNTAAIRKAQLAALDPANRALEKQLWAITDAKAAADAAQQLSDAWKSVGDTISDEIKRIRGLSDDAGSQSYAQLLGQFNAATKEARAGDQDAAKSLPDLSKSLLDAAALVATSQQELDRIQSTTANSLQATLDLINKHVVASDTVTGAMTSAGAGAAATPDQQSWWDAFATSQVAAAPTASNDAVIEIRALLAETKTMHADMKSGFAAVAAPANKTAKILDAVTGPTGGDAISTKEAA